MKNKVVILTSRQNHVWTSMQEIVPLIEEQWSSMSDSYDITLLNCDSASTKDITKAVLNSDLIILTVFNTSIAKAARITREMLSIDTPWVVYLHGQATLGMWPYSTWGLSTLFKDSDYFVGTCDGDEKSLRLVYPNAKFYKNTFSYVPLPKGKTLQISKSNHSFVYVGRISAQKQLHQLLWAYSLFKKESSDDVDIHFFGSEDDLGSPNLRIPGEGYLDFLKSLCKQLGIEDFVHFHGFVQREDIHTTLKDWSHTLVYPSLHSDENFGMSLMRGLCEGSTAISTKWGGFTEHLQEFPKSLKCLNVLKGKHGPYISINDFVTILSEYKNLVPAKKLPSRYSNSLEIDKLKQLASVIIKDKASVNPLSSTKLLKALLLQKDLLVDPKAQQIFKDYSDPIAHQFFEAYGMINSDSPKAKAKLHAPWIKKDNESFVSNEPHKGPISLESEDELITNGLALI